MVALKRADRKRGRIRLKTKLPRRWIVFALVVVLLLFVGQFISLLLDFWEMGSIPIPD